MAKKSSVSKSVTGRTKNQKYLAQRQAIAPYVSRQLLRMSPVRRTPTEYEKRRVRAYFHAISGTKAEPGIAATVVYPIRLADIPKKAYRTRKEGEAVLRKMQAENGNPPLKYLAAAIIPTHFNKRGKPVKPRIRYRKDAPNKVTIMHVESQTALFTPAIVNTGSDTALASHVDATVARLPTGKKTTLHVRCGEFNIETSLSKRELPGYVVKLRAQYSTEGAHHYRRWQFGITARRAKNQKDREALRAAILESRQRKRAGTRAAKRNKRKGKKK